MDSLLDGLDFSLAVSRGEVRGNVSSRVLGRWAPDVPRWSPWEVPTLIEIAQPSSVDYPPLRVALIKVMLSFSIGGLGECVQGPGLLYKYNVCLGLLLGMLIKENIRLSYPGRS